MAEHILPEFSKLKETDQLTVLKALAESSEYARADDARLLLPAVYTLLEEHTPTKPETPAAEQPNINFSMVECLLFAFYYLASKAPGALAPICGIKVLTGQPSDMVLGDFSAKLEDFKSRVAFLDECTNEYVRRLQAVLGKLNTETTASDEERTKQVRTSMHIRELRYTQQQNKEAISSALKTINNIRAITKKLTRLYVDYIYKSFL